MCLWSDDRDEILYDAKIHPEQYSNTLSSAQVKQLHKSILYVCGLSVKYLADSSKFPEEWLFKHRWAKGKKDSATKLPNGSKFVFLTVGGRTSCVVPSVQKKTGPVKKDVEDEVDEDDEVKIEEEGEAEEDEQTKPAKRKRPVKNKKEEADEEIVKLAAKSPKNKKQKVKREEEPVTNGAVKHEESEMEKSKAATKKRKSNTKTETGDDDTTSKKETDPRTKVKGVTAKPPVANTRRRRSARTSTGMS